ncbi:MAG: ABC transporter permease [Candidatus Woesearchaeota archaeon]
MINDYIKLAVENITHRQLRSWLTILGIVVGIAAVVALVSLGRGMQYTVDQQFSKIGADMVTVQAKTSSTPGVGSGSNVLTQGDYDVVRRSDGVDDAVQLLMRVTKIEYNKKTKFSYVRGMPTDETSRIYKSVSMYDVENGRMIRNGDKNKIVIGPEFAKEENFGREIKIDDKVTINGREFVVIGIFKTGNNPGISQAVVMTLDDMRSLFDEPEEVSAMMVKVTDPKDMDSTIENIKKDLRRHRGVKEGREDFTVQSTKSFIESFLVVFNVITVLLVGLASISLLVGAIGIANTMYTAVLERTREIGVMKAIGARNSQILTLFLIESSIIGLIGGTIGMLIGVGISLVAQQLIGTFLGPGFFQVFLPWWLLTGAAGFALIIGMISGILPAKQAADMRPVEALRG